MTREKQDVINDLLIAVPYIRRAINVVKEEGKTVKLGILAVNEDGSGRIEIQFDCDEFFADIAALIDLPDENEDNVAEYAAMKFMSQHGLNPPT